MFTCPLLLSTPSTLHAIAACLPSVMREWESGPNQPLHSKCPLTVAQVPSPNLNLALEGFLLKKMSDGSAISRPKLIPFWGTRVCRPPLIFPHLVTVVLVELLEAMLMGGVGAIDDGNAHDDFDPVFDEPRFQLIMHGVTGRRSRCCNDGIG